jgi:hypothetical protein
MLPPFTSKELILGAVYSYPRMEKEFDAPDLDLLCGQILSSSHI